MSNKKRVVSLFAGCGGLDLGFKDAEFEIVFANDNEPKVKERKNYSDDGTVLIETVKVLPNETVIMYCRPNLEPYRNQSPWGIAVEGYKGHCKFEKHSDPSHLQVR